MVKKNMLGVFDIGGTHMRIGVAKDFTALEKSVMFDTPKSFDEGIGLLIKALKDLAGNTPFTAIAGGIAGPLDVKKEYIPNSPNMPGWTGKPIKKILEDRLSTHVFLENDAAMGALGEAVYGAGKGYKIVSYLGIGTGVGGARIVNGIIDTTTVGFEPGHQIISSEKREDACGPKGHLEAFISGSALERKYKMLPEKIIEGAVWDEVAKYLAIGLNNCIVHWSPEIVVLAGAVSVSIPLEVVNKELSTLMTIYNPPIIVKGSLGAINGLYGGMAYLESIFALDKVQAV